MTDPISIISGVLGIATAGVTLAKRLNDLCDQFGDAYQDIANIASDINGFSIVLKELGRLLDVPAQQQIASDDLMTGIKDVTAKCDMLFQSIRKMISTANGAKLERLKTKARWVFREARVKTIKATLDGFKSTLILMLEMLRFGNERDKDDKMERMMLENLVKTQKRSVQVLQTTVEETDEKDSLPDTNVANENPAPLLTGYFPPVQPAGKTGNLARSTSILLKNTVPSRDGEDRGEILDSIQPQNGSQHTSYPASYSSPHPNNSTTPPSFPAYSNANSSAAPQYNVPSISSNHSSGPSMAVGVAAPRFQKSDIDLLLSKWINPAKEQSKEQDTNHKVHKSLYEQLPLAPSTKAAYSDDEKAALEVLKSERLLLDDRFQQQTEIVKIRMESQEKELKEQTVMVERRLEEEQVVIEDELMQCEANMEKQKSIEQELERCREDLRVRILDKPEQSHETLRRHIQNTEERISKFKEAQEVLHAHRIRLLEVSKTARKFHESTLAELRDDHKLRILDLEAKKLQLLRSYNDDIQQLWVDDYYAKNILGKYSICPECMKEHEEDKSSTNLSTRKLACGHAFHISCLQTCWSRNKLPTSAVQTCPVCRKSVTEKATTDYSKHGNTEEKSEQMEKRAPAISTHESPRHPGQRLQIRVPDWLNDNTIEDDDPNPTQPPDFGLSDKMPVEDQEPKPNTEPKDPKPQPSSTPSPKPEFRSRTPSAPSTPIPNLQPRTPSSSSASFPLSSPTPSELHILTTLCRRPAWKPPLAYNSGTNTISSIVNLTPYLVMYFKASQDAYHFYLSSSTIPFYIVELVPSDLTTFQTSKIEWTVLPKVWASRTAVEAHGYAVEEDSNGQMWIRKELNWPQICQLFDFTCGLLDNRLNFASRRILEKRAAEKEEKQRVSARLLAKLRGAKEAKLLEELHGGFFDAK